jgi:hypothetical protein
LHQSSAGIEEMGILAGRVPKIKWNFDDNIHKFMDFEWSIGIRYP